MAKTWLITGSSRGFGWVLAKAVLEDGDNVVATARRPEQLDDLIRQHGFLRASGHFLQKPFSVDDLVRKVQEVLRGRVA